MADRSAVLIKNVLQEILENQEECIKRSPLGNRCITVVLALVTQERTHFSRTSTKSSTYVKFVITFEGAANPTHNLSLCGSHNHNWYG